MEIVDNLTSTATNVALSANQGRLLKEAIDKIPEVTVIDLNSYSALQSIKYGTKLLVDELNNYYKKEDIILVIGSNNVYLPKEGQQAKNVIYYKNELVYLEVTQSRGHTYLCFEKAVNNLTEFYVKDFTCGVEVRYAAGVMSDIYGDMLPDRLLLYGQATRYIAYLSNYNTTLNHYCYTFTDENNKQYQLKFMPNTNTNKSDMESNYSYILTKLN